MVRAVQAKKHYKAYVVATAGPQNQTYLKVASRLHA